MAMTDRTCAVCGKTPTDGAASIITGDEKQWYCHDDEHVTCYMRAVMGTTADALEAVDDLANEIRRVDGAHNLGAGALAEALGPWLAEHDRQVAERAWDEGARWAAVEFGGFQHEKGIDLTPGDNPYENTSQSRTGADHA